MKSFKEYVKEQYIKPASTGIEEPLPRGFSVITPPVPKPKGIPIKPQPAPEQQPNKPLTFAARLARARELAKK
jgi:hypothetical protein